MFHNDVHLCFCPSHWDSQCDSHPYRNINFQSHISHKCLLLLQLNKTENGSWSKILIILKEISMLKIADYFYIPMYFDCNFWIITFEVVFLLGKNWSTFAHAVTRFWSFNEAWNLLKYQNMVYIRYAGVPHISSF